VGCQVTAPADEAASSDGGSENGSVRPTVGEAPTARATSSVAGFVFPGDEVALTGTGSDPDQADGDPDPVLRWFQIEGTQIELAGADTDSAGFTVPQDVVPGETLGFELRVTDADGNTTTDAVFLFIPRGEAVVRAAASGPADAVLAGDEVTLSSSGSLNIPEESAEYLWEQVEGPAVELQNADTQSASFVAPDPGRDEITLLFELTLANRGETSRDVIEVIVAPAGPGEPEPPGGDPAAGQTAYAENGCSACHAEDASGGSGPNLQGADRAAALQERFGDGGNHFGTIMTDEQVGDVAAWLATLGDAADEPDGPGGPCDVAGADAGTGEAAFAGNTCSTCHLADASGLIGPSLRGGDRTAALEERFLPEGTLHNGASLAEDEVLDLACWFSSLEP
ncbi:MAG: PKD domain-containing protein, partial [Planctomycetota bacterium]